MGGRSDEDVSDGKVPTVKAVVEHITNEYTANGVYPRGSGEDFLQVVLPNRMPGFPAFLREIEQCAGTGSQICFVATTDETRLDIYLGSRYESGSPIARQQGSTTWPLLIGLLLGFFLSVVLPSLLKGTG